VKITIWLAKINMKFLVISNQTITGVASDENIVPMLHIHPIPPGSHGEELVILKENNESSVACMIS